MRNFRAMVLVVFLFLAGPAGARDGVTQLLAQGQGYAIRAPRGMTLDAKGNLYVVGFMTHNVLRVAPDGTVTEIIDATGDGTTRVEKPREVAVDAQGNVYVASEMTHSVFRIAPDGKIDVVLGPEGDGQEGKNHRLRRPTYTVVSPKGDLYVAAQTSDNVFHVTPKGKVELVADKSGAGEGKALVRPNGLAMDGEGNVYVAGARSRNVFRISPAGELVEIFDGKSAAEDDPQLVFPNYVAVDAKGNVYVTGNNSGNMLRIAKDGAVEELAPPPGREAMLGGPTSVAVSPDGTVFFSRMGPYGVWRAEGGGEVTKILGTEGAGEGQQLWSPRRLLAAPDGSLYIAGYRSNNVLRLSAAAARETPTGLKQEPPPPVERKPGAGKRAAAKKAGGANAEPPAPPDEAGGADTEAPASAQSAGSAAPEPPPAGD